MSGMGWVWCLAPLDPWLPATPFGRGLLMDITQEVQSSPPIVPVGPTHCKNSDPASLSVFIISSRRSGWDGTSVCSRTQHPLPSSIRWRAAGRSSDSWRGTRWQAGWHCQPSSVPHAAAFWGGKCSDHSLPGWDLLTQAVSTMCLIRTDTYGPTSVSCRISLCSVLLRT